MSIILKSRDFARMAGWGEAPSAVRRARRWLKRTGVGKQYGRDVEWTSADLQASAPGVANDFIAKGLLDP